MFKHILKTLKNVLKITLLSNDSGTTFTGLDSKNSLISYNKCCLFRYLGKTRELYAIYDFLVDVKMYKSRYYQLLFLKWWLFNPPSKYLNFSLTYVNLQC